MILVNSYLLSSYKLQTEFQNALILALFERESKSQRRCCISVSISDEHKLECQKILQYCSVCVKEPTRKCAVLEEISGNSLASQKRKKTTYDCTTCDIPLCKEDNCFSIHQSIV